MSIPVAGALMIAGPERAGVGVKISEEGRVWRHCARSRSLTETRQGPEPVIPAGGIVQRCSRA
jgi:hypothetical protein